MSSMKTERVMRNLVLGAVAASLPLVLCWGLAELMVRVGVEMVQPPAYLARQRRNIAGIVWVIGFVMSAVAWCGVAMYAVTTILSAWPRWRHERKLARLRERGEIE